jgi:hypothetical protein
MASYQDQDFEAVIDLQVQDISSHLQTRLEIPNNTVVYTSVIYKLQNCRFNFAFC